MRELPQPPRLERWVSEGGCLVELLLPRTDAGVLVQALITLAAFALPYRPARRAGLLQLWAGGFVFVAGAFALRESH